jgi:hypothetical protein
MTLIAPWPDFFRGADKVSGTDFVYIDARKAFFGSRHLFPDFPEFAQAVRYGVLASGKLWEGGRDLNSETFR